MEEVGGNFDGSRYKNEIMWCIVLASYTHLENPQKRERNPLGKKKRLPPLRPQTLSPGFASSPVPQATPLPSCCGLRSVRVSGAAVLLFCCLLDRQATKPGTRKPRSVFGKSLTTFVDNRDGVRYKTLEKGPYLFCAVKTRNSHLLAPIRCCYVGPDVFGI